MSASHLIQIGTITAAHGTAGLVIISSDIFEADELTQFTQVMDQSCRQRFSLTPEGQKQHKLIARLSGVNDRNAAEKLRGTALYTLVPEDELDYFTASEHPLIDCEVLLEDGSLYGSIIHIDDFGAGEIATIKRVRGKEEMVPLTPSFFRSTEAENNQLTIFPPSYLDATSQNED